MQLTNPTEPKPLQIPEGYDPSGVAVANGALFGLPFTPEESHLIILPVPWEVTVSYRAGTAQAPDAIKEASLQVDLYDADAPQAWQRGIAMLNPPLRWVRKNAALRRKAERHIAALADGKPGIEAVVREVNRLCEELNEEIRIEAMNWLEEGKVMGILGGEHSVPLGLIWALAETKGNFGILQIDAHADLREAYEGFTYSHASIMRNASKVRQVEKLVQVGLRDMGADEVAFAQENKARIKQFTWRELSRAKFKGELWKDQCKTIVGELPQKVYISFDIDGLDPTLCPNTGTPVPGGLSFEEAFYLIEEVKRQSKEIIGFDLVEVGTHKDASLSEWDAIVGARALFRMACIING